MSNEKPAGGSPRHLWWLLVLPLFLAAGWLVGQAPTPAPRPDTRGGRRAYPASLAPPIVADSRSAAIPEAAPEPGAASAPSGEPSQWTTLDDAVAESKRTGKPVMIDFSADWCGPCQALRREVFEDASLGREVEMAVIPVSIVDRRREEGSNPADIDELQQRYDLRGFPTLVVFSPATGRTEKAVGFGGPGRTVEWITGAARSVR